jgi:hypothetical protein
MSRSDETAANNSKFARRLIFTLFLLHSSAREDAPEQLAVRADDDERKSHTIVS